MIRRPPRSTRTDTLVPTRRSSDLRGLLRHLEVAAHHAVAAGDDVADHAGGHVVAVVVHDPQIDPGRRLADRAEQVLLASDGSSVVGLVEHGLEPSLGAGTEGVDEVATEALEIGRANV